MSDAGPAAIQVPAAPGPAPRRPWSHVQVIYYLLAALNLIAIGAGLYLGHRGIEMLERGIDDSTLLERHLVLARRVSDAAIDAQASVISAIHSGDVAIARGAYLTRMDSYDRDLRRLRDDVSQRLAAASRKRALALIDRLGQGRRRLDTAALAAFDALSRGDRDAGLAMIADMQLGYVTLRAPIRDINQFFGLLKSGAVEREKAQVQALRRYETLIGGLVLVTIACSLCYGYFVGRLMRRKYSDLEGAHSALAASHAEALELNRRIQQVNDDVTALNVQLGENMRRMNEMQDEAIRRGKLAQLGQLTATVAHELRNPLGAVRTSVYLLERKSKAAGLDFGPQFERINGSILRCDGIIGQLLAFARNAPAAPAEVAIDDWLAKVLAEEAERLPANVEIHFAPDLGAQTACVDVERLRRVLINLLSNASEAMVGRDGGTPAMPACQPTITVASRETGRGIEISVSDNGPGIAEDIRGRILEPLFTTKSFGTGLGLPEVEKILQDHGGGLEFASVEPHGTCFTVWLPLQSQKREAAR